MPRGAGLPGRPAGPRGPGTGLGMTSTPGRVLAVELVGLGDGEGAGVGLGVELDDGPGVDVGELPARRPSSCRTTSARTSTTAARAASANGVTRLGRKSLRRAVG